MVKLYLLVLLMMVGCGGAVKTAPTPRPSADELIAHLVARQERIQSVTSESVMDYWTGSERVKATVLMIGTRGAKVRFNALNPDGGSTAADMACDGRDFFYVDYHHNCVISGPCDQKAIETLLHVALNPDDFLLLAIGATPLIAHDTARVSWDEKRGAERLDLIKGSQRQTLYLSPIRAQWDILESSLSVDDTLQWKLTQKDFFEMTDDSGKSFRLPERSRFEQPRQKADLVTRWQSRVLNTAVEDDKFRLVLPPQSPRCGAK